MQHQEYEKHGNDITLQINRKRIINVCILYTEVTNGLTDPNTTV